MASLKLGNYVVILVLVGSASAGDVQFVMQCDAKSGEVWFLTCRILPNETHVVAAARVLLRETGLQFSRDDLQLVRDEVVSITL
jgi:hypothetical protein